MMSNISKAFAYSVGFTALALILFGGIKGQFTGIKAKSAGQTLLVGELAAAVAYALAHAFGG